MSEPDASFALLVIVWVFLAIIFGPVNAFLILLVLALFEWLT